MKIAVTGKGGSGKTTVAAIVARSLARRGWPVVAVDGDPNPNLGIALGLGVEATSRLEGVVNAVLRERAAHRHSHEEGEPHVHPPSEELADEMGVVAPDGVVLVQTGRIERPAEGCLCCGSHATTRRMFGDLDAAGKMVVADLEAGVNDLVWAYPKAEDTVLIVTEPYVKSLEVARRAAKVARELEVRRVLVVANRVEDSGDLESVRNALPGLEVVEVPEDPEVTRADRQGVAPIDAAPGSPAVRAVGELAERLAG